LLAVDESTPTIGKRLAGINMKTQKENRQAYRGMIFTAKGLGDFISGAILFERLCIKIMQMVSQWLQN
jgi:fructose-bisphosphate aldolase class I